MINENIQKFLNFLAEDKERQAKSKSFDGDMDALVAYARESGFEVSAQELLELRENSRKLLESRMKKAEAQKAGQTPGVQAIYAMMALAETDSEVAKKLEALVGDEDVTRAELIAYGKEKGFIFDEQDLDAVGRDILEPSDELSEEELELVAGGTTSVLFGVIVVGAIVFCLAGIVATWVVWSAVKK